MELPLIQAMPELVGYQNMHLNQEHGVEGQIMLETFGLACGLMKQKL